MNSDSGQVIVQPGETVVLRQLKGWRGLLLWAKVTAVTTDPAPAEQPVRFTCPRESAGTKATAANGFLIAGPTSLRPSAQVLTVGDYAELLLPKAFLRSSSPYPVRIDWVAIEPEHAPQAAVADVDSFLPIGSSGSAATPCVDRWGRLLSTAAPLAATFQTKHNGGFAVYPPTPLLSAAKLGAIALGNGLSGGAADKLSGWIAVTELYGKTDGPGESITITTLATPAGMGDWSITTIDVDGAAVRNWSTPPLFYFNLATGTLPQVSSSALAWVELYGYLILLPASTESDP